jgi:ATP-dependent RNA helicase MSS116
MEAHKNDFKVIVFFTTARITQLYANLFVLMGFPVMEIHSRLSQSRRDTVSKVFRESSQSILFTSDVSARGMDYPDVTRVIQVCFFLSSWAI